MEGPEAALPLLPTTVVGSHGIPGWLHVARAEIARGAFGVRDVEEVYEDAVRLALLDQESAGIDVVTDGEMRRLHFVQGFYGRLTGLEQVDAPRRLGAAGYDQIPRYRAVDRVRAPSGLGIVEEFEVARTLTAKPLKLACPGPMMFTLAVDLGEESPYGSHGELAEEFAGIINMELRRLADAGATFLQLDDPSLSLLSHGADEARGQVEVTEMVGLFNRAAEGVSGRPGVRVALHLCFGNFRGHSRTSPRSYRNLFPGILDARCDQFVLEFANRELADLEIWREFAIDRELGAGVVDVKSFYPERPDEIAARLRRALEYVPPEKLWVNPDCGFNHSARWVAAAKLRAMVQGVQIVRRELSGAD